MISLREYEDTLKKVGVAYFVHTLEYVPDITKWARENETDLSEPYNPMKLIPRSDDGLIMIMQSKIHDEMLDDVIKHLGIRWSVRDNAFDMEKKLNSIRKRIVYCFLKERARSMKDIGGNEMIEDQWVIDEMESLGFFEE